MKILRFILLLTLPLGCSGGLFAQARVGAWSMHEGKEGLVSFPTSDASSRKAAFAKAVVPPQNDADWKPAKTNSDGTVNFSQRSQIARCGGQLDFTYFQAPVYIPANMNVSTLTVSYDRADDGARIYFFNSKYPNGHYEEASDLIGGVGYKAVDLKDQVVKGEDNRVVIVQYDNCPVQNNIQGIRIKVNGQEVKPQPPVVTLYQSANFTGAKKEITGDWSAASDMAWNDKVNSIKVPAGYKIIIYEDGPTKGRSIELTKDWVADASWMNRLSNIKMVAKGQ